MLADWFNCRLGTGELWHSRKVISSTSSNGINMPVD